MKSIITKVQLNDIFQPESEKLIKERIDYALNKEGAGINFWRHFFLCDTIPRCVGEGVITYLFTEQQLGILRDWWDLNTGKTCEDQVLKYNLESSRTDFFEDAPLHRDVLPIEPVYACCITKYKMAGYPEAVRLIFSQSPTEKLPYQCINFFEENKKFNTTTENFSRNRKTDIFLGLVNDLRSVLESVIRSFKNKSTMVILKSDKYFLFLGNHYGTHKWLEYCKNKYPEFSRFIEKYLRDKANNTSNSVQGNI